MPKRNQTTELSTSLYNLNIKPDYYNWCFIPSDTIIGYLKSLLLARGMIFDKEKTVAMKGGWQGELYGCITKVMGEKHV